MRGNGNAASMRGRRRTQRMVLAGGISQEDGDSPATLLPRPRPIGSQVHHHSGSHPRMSKSHLENKTYKAHSKMKWKITKRDTAVRWLATLLLLRLPHTVQKHHACEANRGQLEYKCLFVSRCGPAINWQHVQGVTPPLPEGSWDTLFFPRVGN